jgi:hypothetical protein
MVVPRNDRVNDAAGQVDNRPRGVGGWLLLLCLLLLVGQPIDLAVGAARAVSSLPMRGAPLALVVLGELLVAGVGIAAGLALLGCQRGAATFAKSSLFLSAAMDVFVYTTPFVPNNRLPGTTPILLGASLAYYAVWIVYLFRSERVRNTFASSGRSTIS